MDGAQITGSASSYARKYALNGLFAIDDGVDPDSTNKGEDAPAKKESNITFTIFAEFFAPAVPEIAFAVSTGLLKDELILSTSLFPLN